jgi:hypothetical protein
MSTSQVLQLRGTMAMAPLMAAMVLVQAERTMERS